MMYFLDKTLILYTQIALIALKSRELHNPAWFIHIDSHERAILRPGSL